VGRDGAVNKVIRFGKPELFLRKGLDTRFAKRANQVDLDNVSENCFFLHQKENNIKASLRHSGARVSASPESRATNLRIPGLRQEAHPGMTREYGRCPASLLVPIMRRH